MVHTALHLIMVLACALSNVHRTRPLAVVNGDPSQELGREMFFSFWA